MHEALDADGDHLDEHVVAIGTLVLNMTRLESVILDLIGIFMEPPSALHTLAAFSHQQTTSNIETLMALATLGEDDDAKDNAVVTTLKKARELVEFRNTVVHAHWATGDDGSILAVRFYGRGKFRRVRKPISAEAILQRAAEAKQFSATLRGLRDHLHIQFLEQRRPSGQ